MENKLHFTPIHSWGNWTENRTHNSAFSPPTLKGSNTGKCLVNMKKISRMCGSFQCIKVCNSHFMHAVSPWRTSRNKLCHMKPFFHMQVPLPCWIDAITAYSYNEASDVPSSTSKNSVQLAQYTSCVNPGYTTPPPKRKGGVGE